MKIQLTLLFFFLTIFVQAQNFSPKLAFLDKIISEVTITNVKSLMEENGYEFAGYFDKKKRTFIFSNQSNYSSEDLISAYFDKKTKEFQMFLLILKQSEVDNIVTELKNSGFVSSSANIMDNDGLKWEKKGYKHKFFTDNEHSTLYMFNGPYIEKYR